MYEPAHFLPFCRFNLEHMASTHLPAAASGTVGGITGSNSAAEIDLRDGDDTAPAASVGLSAPSLRLNHGELWHKFSAVGTEMVITKSGRRVYTAHSLKLYYLLFPHDLPIKCHTVAQLLFGILHKFTTHLVVVIYL